MRKRTSDREIYRALRDGRGKTFAERVGSFFGNKRILGTKIKFISIKEKDFTKIVNYRRRK